MKRRAYQAEVEKYNEKVAELNEEDNRARINENENWPESRWGCRRRIAAAATLPSWETPRCTSVITSYSIHYTKLYEFDPPLAGRIKAARRIKRAAQQAEGREGFLKAIALFVRFGDGP